MVHTFIVDNWTQMKKDLEQMYDGINLWDLDIAEITGHSLEAKDRDAVNQLLHEGWVLLHVYTLKYKQDSLWRQRPMGILGKPKQKQHILKVHEAQHKSLS